MRVFSREGEYWTIRYAGRLARLRDSKGVGYLATLLGNPGARVHVSMLTGAPGSDSDPRRVEQDRVNVTKGIQVAIRRIADHNPELGLHLQKSIRTGRYCSYSPVVWEPLASPGGVRHGGGSAKRPSDQPASRS